MNERFPVLVASQKKDTSERIREVLRRGGLAAITISSAEEIPENESISIPSLILLCGERRSQLGLACKGLSLRLNIPLAVLGRHPSTEETIEEIAEGTIYRITTPLEGTTLVDRVRSIIASAGKADSAYPAFPVHPARVIEDQARDILATSLMSRKILENLRKAELRISGSLSSQPEEAEGFTPEDLQGALERNQFLLFFQPIVNLDSGRITGFESLVRWDHPLRGIVSPDEFIPTAERSGIIHELGDFVIEQACLHLSHWHQIFPRTEPLTVSFNVSAAQFTRSDLCDRIIRSAETRCINNDSLRVEVTESIIMGDMEASNLMLLTLKSRGFQLYMDDFGTGYSSLSYLRHFPMDVLKIDKSFVEWIHIDEESEVIVKTIIDLAHNLGMKVIAEGVESAEHLDKLRSYGCDYGQGYYFSRPIPAEKTEELLTQDPRW